MFAGFVPPTRNYFPMPNEWTNITAEIDSLAELKIVEYVLRHTWGYHEFNQCKTISIDEFMYGRKRSDGSRMDKGTKLSRPSVIDGTKRAISDGYLICIVDDSDQARIKKAYALNMRNDVKDLSTSSKDSLPPTQSRNFTPEVKNADSSSKDSTPRSEKETLERHLGKERETPDGHPSETDSPSLSPDSSLQETITDQQADFWLRWCAIAGPGKLNETASKHIVTLAVKVTSTPSLQSLYDFTYDHIKALANAAGKEAIPPRLGNLVKCLPEWEQSQKRQDQEQTEREKTREHIPGTGHLTNLTEQRLKGETPPPLVYTRLENKKTSGAISQQDLPTSLQERLAQRRKVEASNAS